MDSKLALSATCHFLCVPLEIRHGIYRYLLLDPPEASLDPGHDENIFIEIMQEEHEYKATGGANDFPEHSSNDPDPEGDGVVMHNHLIADEPNPPWETHPLPPPAIEEEEFAKRSPTEVTAEEERIAGFKRKFEDEHKIHRYPAILQTNRQIHDEASTFLYSSLVMEVRPGDVISSNVWNGIVEPSAKIWHSSPTQEYKGSNLSGTMEPHVFAKFERIAFSADLNFDLRGKAGRVWPALFVDENLRTSREDEDSFIACLNGEGPSFIPVSDIFQQFVNVLEKSPYISHLDVCLGVEIVAAFDADSEEEEEEGDDDEENLERADLIEECEARKENAATKRGMELILEAGVLNPLKKLENVKYFSLSFDVLPCNDVEFEPKHKHLDIIRDLKETVEGNFLAKRGPV